MFVIISKHIRKDPCLNLYFLCKLENYLNQTTFNDTNYPIISTALVEFSQWKYETKHFVIMHFISNNIIIKCFSWTVWGKFNFIHTIKQLKPTLDTVCIEWWEILPKVEDVFGSWKLRVYWTARGLNASIACYRAAHMRASLITTIISTLIQF